MESSRTLGLEVNKVKISQFFTDKIMILAYIFLALAAYGVVEMVYERYFHFAATTAADAGLFPGDRDVAIAMKEAVFGHGGEVKRESPWSLYIVNYMYMIYVGSGIIFIVAAAEILEIKDVIQTACGFMTLGLAMVFAGLFTIMMDLNVTSLQHMLLTPQYTSGMWLMMPLYAVYIPLVILEIYLILAHKDMWIKKIAFAIIIVGLLVEFVEFYIQAKLFDMNSARHLWTTYPMLPLYFMVSSFAASLAIMILYTYLNSKNLVLIHVLERVALYLVMALAMFEALAYLNIDRKWGEIIMFGDFKYYFYLYLILAIIIPFTMLFRERKNKYIKIIASISIILGTFVGKAVFVYGGNAYPMSDRFGVGFEKYSEYEEVKEVVFFMPPLSEVAIIIGSIGVILFVYRVVDLYFSVSNKYKV